MRVLREFRSFLEALQQLVATCQAISFSLAAGLDREGDDDEMRQQVEGLLLSRATWEAEMEGLLLKADSTLKAASNAESRQRTMLRHAEKLTDPLDLESAEIEDVVPDSYAEGGEAEGVLPLRVDVAPSPKQIALRHKFS